MSLIARFGGIYGHIPMYMGRVFFVSPGATYIIDGRTFSASDNNDGLHPERALRTVNQAVTNATADAGDVILLLEGTHTVTATVRLNKAGLTVWGVHSGPGTVNAYQPRTILTSTGTSIPLLALESSNTEVAYLDLRPTTAYSAVIVPTTSGLNGLYIHGCHVDLETPTAAAGTHGIDLAYRSVTRTLVGSDATKDDVGGSVLTNVLIEDCVFESDGAQGNAIAWASAYGAVRRCHFYSSAGTWATVFKVATATDNLLIDACVWTTTGTMTVAIDGTDGDTVGSCTIQRCTFNGAGAAMADAIRGFATTEVLVTECYTGSAANGTSSSVAISRMLG